MQVCLDEVSCPLTVLWVKRIVDISRDEAEDSSILTSDVDAVFASGLPSEVT